MTAIELCPALTDFQALLDGRLSGVRQGPVLAHLEACPRCAETVQSLLNNDTLASALHATPLLDAPPSGLVERILAIQLDDDIGLTQLGPYKLRERLGQGGMGIVYLAEDTALHRVVALKIMRPKVARSAAAKERFLREARSAAAVRSDHVVTIYATGEEAGVAFVAMERLTGSCLADRLSAPFAVNECVRIAREMALGLAAAHAQGLVHRDIKPENVWLEESGRVKLLDFGLARPISSDVQLTTQGTIVGTPAFMAPEQAAGLSVDARSDLFSLGAVLYRVLTGRLPFEGANIMALLSALANSTPPRAGSLNAAVSPGLDKLLTRLLAKDPGKRPASAQAVAEELAALETQPVKEPTRRKMLSLAALPVLGLGGYFAWPKTAAQVEVPAPATAPRFELRLDHRASMFVGNFDLDPARTVTIEGFVTLEDERFHAVEAQQIIATNAISIFANHGKWAVGCKVKTIVGEESFHFNGPDPKQNRRCHLAFVHLGPQLRLYLDGRGIAGKDIGHDTRFLPHKFFMLGGNAQNLLYDEVRVSTIARYSGNFTPKERHETDEHTFALYHLDESEGLVVIDSSGHGRHGANHSGEWVRV